MFFVANLVLFYLAGVGGAQEGVVFYIWVGIFNVFVISQVWAFANDIYTEAQGKRLFPMIGVGSSLGAWLGALGAEPPGLGACTPRPINCSCWPPRFWWSAAPWWSRSTASRPAIPLRRWPATPKQKLAEGDGFALIFRSRYLI